MATLGLKLRLCVGQFRDKYEGEWQDDLKHGYGVYTYVDSGSQVTRNM